MSDKKLGSDKKLTVYAYVDGETHMKVYSKVDGPKSALAVELEGEWYVKKVPTLMVRMDGPFMVETSESPTDTPFVCKDGYLAIDARGYPYAIAANEQEKVYQPLAVAERANQQATRQLRQWAMEQAVQLSADSNNAVYTATKILEFVIGGEEKAVN